jgi:hypothetical protein
LAAVLINHQVWFLPSQISNFGSKSTKFSHFWPPELKKSAKFLPLSSQISKFWRLSLAEGSLQGDPHRALNAGPLLAPAPYGVWAVDAVAIDVVAAAAVLTPTPATTPGSAHWRSRILS